MTQDERITQYHGSNVAIAASICQRLYVFSCRHRFEKSMRMCRPDAVESKYGKLKPAFQDAFVRTLFIRIALLTAIGHICYSYQYRLWVAVISLVLVYFLVFDVVLYPVRVLWFDDLKEYPDPRVWSHRRIFFETGIGFVETLLLFSFFHRLPYDKISVGDALFISVSAATLNAPEHLALPLLENSYRLTLWIYQLAISLLFLVAVFAVLASAGYSRREIASHEGTCLKCHVLKSPNDLVAIYTDNGKQIMCRGCQRDQVPNTTVVPNLCALERLWKVAQSKFL